MFRHNFKYILKVLLKSKEMIFWVAVFPLILSTLFYMAFSNLDNSTSFKKVDVVVVNNTYLEKNPYYKESLKRLQENDILNIKYLGKDEGIKLLDDDIYAVIEFEDKAKIHTKFNGVEQTLVKNVVDQIYEYSEIYKITLEKYAKEGKKIDSNLMMETAVKISKDINFLNNISKKQVNPIVLSYYTVLAMTAIYGATIGLFVINTFNANKSKIGLRMEVIPSHKLKLILSGISAAFLVLSTILLIAFLYLKFVLGIEFGDVLFINILLLLFNGGLAGLSIGVLVGVLLKKNLEVQIGIVISITMVFSVMAGMMGYSIKRLIDTSFPLLNKINPVNLISDGFYSLYYFDDLNRFYSNNWYLVAITIFSTLITYFIARRKNYDSI